MDNIFDQWKKTLQKFNDNMEKELEEVRLYKSQVQAMRHDLESYVTGVRYIRNGHKLILSAPEIVIGNVDMNGDLWGDGASLITIRGNQVNVEGVGKDTINGGVITHKAATIRNIAVDPGPDGKEEVVLGVSQIVNQARSISLYSSEDEGTFAIPATSAGSGVHIHSDAILDIDASASVESKIKKIDDEIKELETQKTTLKTQVSNHKKEVESQIDLLEAIAGLSDGLNEGLQDIRSNVADLIDQQETFEPCAKAFLKVCINYADTMSENAEVCRKISKLKEMKESLNKRKSTFKEDHSGAILNVRTETLNVQTIDGDGNLRVNPDAGINIKTPSLNVMARDQEGKLIPNGKIRLQAETVQLATNDIKYKDAEKQTDADIVAAGSIQMQSKTILMGALDSEVKSGKTEEKALAKDGAIVMRAENISAGAIDKEGKAAGKLALNAKEVEIKATDVKREEGKPDKDDKLAAGGSLLLTAEKIIAGSKSKDNVTKTLQIAADKLGLFGDTTAEMQQGESKAAITLDGGNASLGGSKVELFGDTTIKGKADVKGELKVPKASADQVEVKSAFKSPNINDTMGAGVPGQAEKISAKLKIEEIKEQ